MKAVLQLPAYLYAAIKDSITRLKLVKDNDFIILASIVLALLCYAPIVLFMMVLRTYRFLISMYLRCKYKDTYVGEMEGVDITCCNQYKCVLTVLAFVEFNGELSDLWNAVVEQVRKTIKTRHQKLFYSRGEYMGYHFYYREDVAAEEYVEVMASTGEPFLDKQGLSKNLERYDVSMLPLGDRKLFQILICPQRIKLQEYISNKNIYCVAYRIHHCVGDARTIMHLFKGEFADKESKIVGNKAIGDRSKGRSSFSMKKLKNYLTNVKLKDYPMGVTDKNPLRGFNLSEKKHFIWYTDLSSECLKKIQQIRRAASGSKFLDVVNTCLSSSLHDHYVRKGLGPPKSVIAGIILSPEIVSYSTYGTQEFNLSNTFSAASINFPINVDAKNKLKTRFEILRKEYSQVKKSIDVQFNYFIVQNFFNILPTQITRWMATFLEITVGVSSLPGCESFTMYGGNPVKDLIFLPPNSPGTGMHAIIYTYDRKIRIGFSADRSVIYSYKDAQDIVDNMVVYLHELAATYCKEDLLEPTSDSSTFMPQMAQ